MTRALRGLVVALFTAWASPAQAAYIFRFVDAQGHVHLTDRLGDVPEPYYSAYKKVVDALASKKPDAAVPQPREVLPPPPAVAAPALAPLAESEAARRSAWKSVVAHWRAVLTHAARDLAEAELALSKARQNRLVYQTPDAIAAAAEAESRWGAARQREAEAQRKLLDELPAQARREHAPPAWLE